jgi:hypothetical protein
LKKARFPLSALQALCSPSSPLSAFRFPLQLMEFDAPPVSTGVETLDFYDFDPRSPSTPSTEADYSCGQIPVASISALSDTERLHICSYICDLIYIKVVNPDSLNKSEQALLSNTLNASVRTCFRLSREDAFAYINGILKQKFAIHRLRVSDKIDRRNRQFRVSITNKRALQDMRRLIHGALYSLLSAKYAEINRSFHEQCARKKEQAAAVELERIRELKYENEQKAQKQAQKQKEEQEANDLAARLQSIVANIADNEWD